MKTLDKELRDGLCKLYCYDYDGALDAGVIEPEMELQRLVSAVIGNHSKAGLGTAWLDLARLR